MKDVRTDKLEIVNYVWSGEEVRKRGLQILVYTDELGRTPKQPLILGW